MTSSQCFIEAFHCRSVPYFLDYIFPPRWKAIGARILESGVSFNLEMKPWAAKWSNISPTVRFGNSELETAVKSCIFRVHDLLHQLWGLPIPTSFSDEQCSFMKKANMCGEVAVLTLTEFEYCDYIYQNFEELRPLILSRNAIFMKQGPLKCLTTLQIAQRLDGILHKKVIPSWAKKHEPSLNFCNDYIPMLERDREDFEYNWNIMKNHNWIPKFLPNARYNPNLDGLELTSWMIDDFYHLLNTDENVDHELVTFNKMRRFKESLPKGWGEYNKTINGNPKPEILLVFNNGKIVYTDGSTNSLCSFNSKHIKSTKFISGKRYHYDSDRYGSGFYLSEDYSAGLCVRTWPEDR